MAFAKLFESPIHGQILVVKSNMNEEGQPELRYYVEPPEMGVCSFAIGFQDNDAGWDAAEAAFKATTLESVEEAVSKCVLSFLG
jgi:hypothetical protein